MSHQLLHYTLFHPPPDPPPNYRMIWYCLDFLRLLEHTFPSGVYVAFYLHENKARYTVVGGVKVGLEMCVPVDGREPETIVGSRTNRCTVL